MIGSGIHLHRQARTQKDGERARFGAHPASIGPPDVVMRTGEGDGPGDADTEDEAESAEGGAMVLEWHAHREGNGTVQAAARPVTRAPLRPGVGPRGSSSSTIDGSEGQLADRMDVDRLPVRMADLHTSKGRYVFSLAITEPV